MRRCRLEKAQAVSCLRAHCCQNKGGVEMSKSGQRMICVAAAVLLTSGLAAAADLPSRPAPTAPVLAPVYDWTGIYFGISGGYAFGHSSPMSLYSSSFSAFGFD